MLLIKAERGEVPPAGVERRRNLSLWIGPKHYGPPIFVRAWFATLTARLHAAQIRDECGLPPIILQHHASAARCDQLAAEFLKISLVVVCDADVIAHGEA